MRDPGYFNSHDASDEHVVGGEGRERDDVQTLSNDYRGRQFCSSD